MQPLRHLMIVGDAFRVKGRQQLLNVALQVEEACLRALFMQADRSGGSGENKGQRVVLVHLLALHGIHVPGLKEAHVGVAAIQIVGHLRQQSRHQTGAHRPRFFTQGVGDMNRSACGRRAIGWPVPVVMSGGKGLRVFLRNERGRQ